MKQYGVSNMDKTVILFIIFTTFILFFGIVNGQDANNTDNSTIDGIDDSWYDLQDVNNTDNSTIEDIDDSWYDSQSGEDTGEEIYEEIKDPITNTTDDDGGLFDGLCCMTSMLCIGVCVPTYYLQKRKTYYTKKLKEINREKK